MTDNVQDIIELVNYLQARKGSLSSFLQEVVDFILPDRANVSRFENPGARRGITRYDSTAVEAAEILAGNMAANLTPQSGSWLNYAMADEKLNDIEDVRAWCDEASSITLRALGKSNFYLTMDELYLDLAGFNTACLYSEMVNNRLNFTAWPIRDYTFTMGPDGRTRCLYRDFKMSAENVYKRFNGARGFKQWGAKVEMAMSEQAKPVDRLQMIRIIHEISPREDYNPRRKGRDNMPIRSRYINVDDRVVIAEGGYEEMPANVVRWRLAADDDDGWGRGPGFTSMPDVRSLNNMVRMQHRAAAKDLDPPLVIENRGVIGSVRTTPNGITYVRRDARFEYLTSGQRIDLAQYDLEQMRAQVRAVFFTDHLRLPPPQGTPMTATEMQMRWELMERLLGPTLGRLVVELLNPAVERVFGLLLRAGQIPQPPQQVLNQEINIEYVGPLARAQQMQDVTAIERAYQLAGNLAAVTGDTSVFDNFNTDEAVLIGARLQGLPAKVYRDSKQRDTMREQRAADAQAMQDRQDVALAADVANKAGGANAKAA